TVQWTQQFGTADNEAETRLILDAEDYIYLVGTTTGAFSGTNAGGTDLFVARYDMFGYQSWVKQRGSAGNEETRFITIDDAGNLYVAGATNGDLDGNTNAGGSCSGSTCADIYIMKFSDEPSKVWPKQWGSTLNDYGYANAADPQGNIVVGGISNGNVDDQTVTSSGTTCGSNPCSDNLLTKWMPNGTRLWTRMWGSDKTDVVNGVAIDGTGNIYAAGYTNGDLDGNTNAGSSDVFLTKYLPDGTKAWTKLWGNASANIGNAVTVDGSGNIYVTGKTSGGLDGKSAIGGEDIFITKWHDTGSDATKEWTKVWGNTSGDVGYDLLIDSNNNLYITGASYGGTGTQKDGETYSGNYDLVLMKWSIGADDNSTVRVWTKLWGSSTADYAYSLEKNQDQDLYVTGYTTGTLPSGSLPSNTAQGGYDAFLSRWTQDGSTATLAWTSQWGTPQRTAVQIINWPLTSSGSTYSSAGYGYGVFSGGTGIGTITYNASGATANNWSTGAMDSNDYYQVYFYPNPGNAVTVTAINFSEKRSSNGIRNYKVQYSKSSSFTNPVDLATVAVPDNTETRSGNITGLSISVGLGESIYIRFYGYNSEGQNGTWTIAPNVNMQATSVGMIDQATSLALDTQGNIYVGGLTRGGIDGYTNVYGGYEDYFISKYVADGSRIWTYQNGSTYADRLWGLVRDNSDNLYASGYTLGTLPNNTSAGNADIFLLKVSENGGSLETQTVSCVEDPDRPENSQSLSSTVSVSYSSAGGWSQPAYCEWKCEDEYVRRGMFCEEKICDEGVRSTVACTVVESLITGVRYRICVDNAWEDETGECVIGCTPDTSMFIVDNTNCSNSGQKRYVCNENGALEPASDE
ncbi:MAG TPA: SBBP repeat-containing protein, partial [bacterium]|nr:SBBP repeat-containing protein [bacterium]